MRDARVIYGIKSNPCWRGKFRFREVRSRTRAEAQQSIAEQTLFWGQACLCGDFCRVMPLCRAVRARRCLVAVQEGMGGLQSQQENADEPGPETDVTVYAHVSLDTWFHG